MNRKLEHWRGPRRYPGEAWRGWASRSGGSGAFTLLEVIGALAVLAIMASLMAPVVIRQIDRAVWNQEVASLGSISNAIVLEALRDKKISGPDSWSTDAAKWLDMAPASIAINPRGINRAFLVDQGGWLNTVTLPYTQGSTGESVTNSARVMIVSTIATALPVSSSSISAAAFNDIWITPDGAKPSTWGSWTGRGEDLVIQRINLQQLFHRVILFNRDGAANPGHFTIDTNSTVAVPNQFDSYFLDGSVLALSNQTGFSTEMINQDLSRIYEAGNWSDTLGPGPPSSAATDLETVAYNFVTSRTNTVSPFVAGAALLEYMNTYSAWANLSPCFNYHGQLPSRLNRVPEWQVLHQGVIDFTSGIYSDLVAP